MIARSGGYTWGCLVGQKDPVTFHFNHWNPMSRGAIFLIILLLLLVGGAFFLSSRAHEVPLTKIEADVSRAPTAQ